MPWLAQLRYTFGNRAFVPYVLGSLFVQTAIAVILAAIPFYVKYALHGPESDGSILLGAVFVTAIPAILVWSRVVQRSTPRRALLWSIGIFAAAALCFLIPVGLIGAAVIGVGLGVGVGGLLQLLEVLLAQIIDEDAERTGRRREGVYFGVNGFVVRGSVVLQAIVVAWVLTASGYDAALDTAQPDSVEGGMRILLAVVPLAFLVLAGLSIFLTPTDRPRPASRS